jgi:hypothetical protein
MMRKKLTLLHGVSTLLHGIGTWFQGTVVQTDIVPLGRLINEALAQIIFIVCCNYIRNWREKIM